MLVECPLTSAESRRMNYCCLISIQAIRAMLDTKQRLDAEEE